MPSGYTVTVGVLICFCTSSTIFPNVLGVYCFRLEKKFSPLQQSHKWLSFYYAPNVSLGDIAGNKNYLFFGMEICCNNLNRKR